MDRFYFDDTVVRFFESGNVDALAEALHEVLIDQKLRRSLVKNASAYAVRNGWETSKNGYLQLVDRLICGKHEPSR